jgi:CubicO group peptidase (beta-lactamase class C family)
MTRPMTLSDRLRASAGSVPGVALVVVGPEGQQAQASAGYADLASGTPMAPNVAIPWFSMTKLATATTAMNLAERGLLDLDEPVFPHVPAMRWLRPCGAARTVTVRHLLQHSAGLANPMPITWIHAADEPGPPSEALLDRLLAAHPRLRFTPGERARYSNLGPLILGATIAAVTGQTFESAVADAVLGPLAMSATGFGYRAGVKAATGYHPRYSPVRLLLPQWVTGPSRGRWTSFRPFLVDGGAYGGLVGTLTDAARFLRMHLRDGELCGTRVLAAESAAAMRRITMPGRRADLGLGWLVPAANRNANPPFVEHRGGGAGFFSLMRIYSTLNVGVVVMGNATKYNLDAAASLALEYRR